MQLKHQDIHLKINWLIFNLTKTHVIHWLTDSKFIILWN